MAVYSSAMNEPAGTGIFRVVENGGPGGRVVLRHQAHDATHLIVILGFDGLELPVQLTGAAIAPTSGTGGEWRLSCAEGEFHFRARIVEQVTERPALFTPLHRSFAMSGTDRVAVRVLLWLLRLPGGARLLRHWHSRRG